MKLIWRYTVVAQQTTTGPTSILVKPKIKLHETFILIRSQTGHCVTKNSAVHIVNISASTLLAVAWEVHYDIY